MAERALLSDLPLHLAKHMLLFLAFPKAQARPHWINEIKTALKTLTFKVSEFSTRESPTSERKIKSLFYTPEEIMSELNERAADADEVFTEKESLIKSEEFYLPENYETGDFSSWGFELKETKNQTGIHLDLFYKGQKIT